MGKRMKQIKEEAAAKARNFIDTYPRKELLVKEFSRIMDMSVAIVDHVDHIIPFDDLKEGEWVLPNVDLRVVYLSDDLIKLKWESNDTVYEVPLDSEIKTKPGPGGTRYFSGDSWCTINFSDISLLGKTYELLEEIIHTHKRLGEKSLYPETTLQEQVVLYLINYMIKEKGNIGLYVLKALLMSANNWCTCEIVRSSFFRQILLEGIDKGCLTPEYAEDWYWLEMAAKNNDPTHFMDDMDRWYDILATAMEDGNETARDILNRIWEPEQIIEED